MPGYQKFERHRLWDDEDNYYLEWDVDSDQIWVIDSKPSPDEEGTVCRFSLSSLVEALVESGRMGS